MRKKLYLFHCLYWLQFLLIAELYCMINVSGFFSLQSMSEKVSEKSGEVFFIEVAVCTLCKDVSCLAMVD